MPEPTTAAAPAASVAAPIATATPTASPSPSGVEEPIGTPIPGAETAAPEAGQETTAEPGSEADATAGGSADEKQDARLLPKSIRDLKETNPEAFKAEKERFYEHRSYKQTFPTVAEARRAKQTLELVGGESGLNQMQTDMTEFREVATQYMNGDPEFVNDLAANDPVAFGTHVPNMLNKYLEIDAEGYNREMAKRIHGEHAAANLRPSLENAYAAITAGKYDDAKKILEQIAGWHDRVEQVAKREEDPRYKKLQEQLKTERQSQNDKALSAFNDNYRAESKKAIDTAALRLVKSYFKDSKLDDNDTQIVLRNILRDANAEVLADKDWQTNKNRVLERAYSSGNAEQAIRFASQRFNAALESAVKQAARLFSKGAGTAPRVQQPTNGNGTQAKPPADGFMPVTEMPDPKSIDRTLTTMEMITRQKRAVLKPGAPWNGRKVTWAT